MVPRVGQRIGPYEILGRLGSGGMGFVFSAWDARLHRDVAIKLLREEYATPTMRSRFLQEARAASGLNHPNICTIFDIGEVAGDPFLVMELLKGETLRQRFLQKEKLSAGDIHRIGSEVLDALATAHARGVIHRDIKPANIILVSRPGGGFQSKVLDFGLAKVEFSDEESTRYDLTTIGTTVGTVSYMSPEQARGEAIDARSDLFSLGSVLYEAAAGVLPFQGATSALIFVELLGKAPVPVRQHNAAIPKDLERFIAKLLAKSPGDRFQSAAEALRALRGVSLRRSPLDGLALWSSRPARSSRLPFETQTEAATAPPSPHTPAETPGNRSVSDFVLRPARRSTDAASPRVDSSLATPSPLPTGERPVPTPEAKATPSVLPNPLQDDASSPYLKPGSSMGTVVLRPVKLERDFSPKAERSSGSSGELDVQTPPAPATFREQGRLAPLTADTPRDLLAFEEGLANRMLPGRSVDIVDNGYQQTPAPALQGERAALYSEETGQNRPNVPNASRGRPRTLWWLLAGAIILLAGAFTWYFLNLRQDTGATAPVSVAFGPVQNSTADASLSTIFWAGLELASAQSPRLSIRSHELYVGGLHATGQPSGESSMAGAREAARATGAALLAQGEIRNEGSAYDLTLRLYDVVTGARTAELTETASSREQIPDALDRLATDLRSSQGETSDGIARLAVPLSKEATSNLDALQSYASGLNLEATGNSIQAVLAFRRAISFEPHFTQAFLHIADLDCYRDHAEIAAARAATDAVASASSASPRTQHLAQAVYAVMVDGNYAQATQLLNDVLGTYTGDVQAMTEQARIDFLSGHFADAQDTAENVLRYSHFAPQATELDELTLIAQGRPEAVPSIETQARAAGMPHPDASVIAAAASETGTDMFLPPNVPGLSPATQAGLLDAAGLFDQGAAVWSSMAIQAGSDETLSAAAFADSSAALDHALAGECSFGLTEAQSAQTLPSGPVATFNAAEAEALCGNLDAARHGLADLNGSRKGGVATPTYLVADLTATIAWKSGAPGTALHILDAARQYDPMSLTAYLRGLVEIAAGEPRLSLVQFQAILSHRGPATLFYPETYPLAQLGLSKAYEASGDTANSTAAYDRFREFWKTPIRPGM